LIDHGQNIKATSNIIQRLVTLDITVDLGRSRIAWRLHHNG
jgi:hypothetical protein